MTKQGLRNRRRNYLSQPRTQLRIIGFFLLLALVYGGLNIYISKAAFGNLTDALAGLSLPADVGHDVGILMSDHTATLGLQLGLFTLLSLCMLCLAGVLLSHRIGGPIFHIKKYMGGIVDGSIEPRLLKFRKDDFFGDLAESFNRFQEKVGVLGGRGDRDDSDKGDPGV